MGLTKNIKELLGSKNLTNKLKKLLKGQGLAKKKYRFCQKLKV
jgi:hypothetical protein